MLSPVDYQMLSPMVSRAAIDRPLAGGSDFRAAA
jgi:hypothetical protein